MNDINGTEIKEGDHIELVGQIWLGETLFGRVVVIDDERYPEHHGNLGVAMNNSFTTHLAKGEKYRIIEDYKAFFKERYDKEHGEGTFERLKETLIKRGLKI